MKRYRKRVPFGFGTVLCLLFLSVFSQHSFGTDFSDMRRSFQKDLAKAYRPNAEHRIAIVYDTTNWSRVKHKIDLVKFKKELSHELLKSFEVADPFVVQEVITSNRIAFRQLTEDASILSSFAERADCTQILLVELKALNTSLLVDLKLITPKNDLLSQVVMDIPHEPLAYGPIPEKNVAAEDGESFFERAAEGYTPSSFDDTHNESWLYFAPTAYINPKPNHVELFIWVENLAEVDLEVVRTRYDIRLLENLQAGAAVNTIQEREHARSDKANTDKSSGVHSGYVSVKFQVLDENDLPVAVLIGLKGRVYWDTKNTDFVSDNKDLDDKNNDRNKITLFASLTGKIESIGLLYNGYLDNQTAALGAKYLITSNIKLFAEEMFYYYEKAQVPNDFAAGIQAYNSAGFITTLAYQKATDQFQFGMSYSF